MRHNLLSYLLERPPLLLTQRGYLWTMYRKTLSGAHGLGSLTSLGWSALLPVQPCGTTKNLPARAGQGYTHPALFQLRLRQKTKIRKLPRVEETKVRGWLGIGKLSCRPAYFARIAYRLMLSRAVLAGPLSAVKLHFNLEPGSSQRGPGFTRQGVGNKFHTTHCLPNPATCAVKERAGVFGRVVRCCQPRYLCGKIIVEHSRNGSTHDGNADNLSIMQAP